MKYCDRHAEQFFFRSVAKVWIVWAFSYSMLSPLCLWANTCKCSFKTTGAYVYVSTYGFDALLTILGRFRWWWVSWRCFCVPLSVRGHYIRWYRKTRAAFSGFRSSCWAWCLTRVAWTRWMAMRSMQRAGRWDQRYWPLCQCVDVCVWYVVCGVDCSSAGHSARWQAV